MTSWNAEFSCTQNAGIDTLIKQRKFQVERLNALFLWGFISDGKLPFKGYPFKFGRMSSTLIIRSMMLSHRLPTFLRSPWVRVKVHVSVSARNETFARLLENSGEILQYSLFHPHLGSLFSQTTIVCSLKRAQRCQYTSVRLEEKGCSQERTGGEYSGHSHTDPQWRQTGNQDVHQRRIRKGLSGVVSVCKW